MQIKANADCNCWYRERHKTQRAFGLRKKGTQVQTARARQEIVFETMKLEMKALWFYLIWSKRLERRGGKKITSYRCRVAFNYFTRDMGPADLIQICIWRKNKEVKSLQLCTDHCFRLCKEQQEPVSKPESQWKHIPSPRHRHTFPVSSEEQRSGLLSNHRK